MAKPKRDMWLEERVCRGRGCQVIAGIDEAGRGPLAGPVVAACVVLPYEAELKGVRDSKTLSPEQRDRAFDLVHERAEAIGVGILEPADIDRLNILRATHQAMREALAACPATPDVVLIDGLPVQPFPAPQVSLVKGDSRSLSVAAASIVAKVTRDRILRELDARYPQYGFADHKGYPTPDHLARLEEHGPCPAHRRSFGPVARLLAQPSLPFDDGGRRQTGEDGERVAAAHLAALGWQVALTRYHCHGGELDVVAWDGDTLVFVEVKARRHGVRAPAEAVHVRKRARMRVAAETLVHERGWHDRPCRFDVVEVLFGPDGLATANLIRAAFEGDE